MRGPNGFRARFEQVYRREKFRLECVWGCRQYRSCCTMVHTPSERIVQVKSMIRKSTVAGAIPVLCVLGAQAFAAEPAAELDSGNTAWMLMAAVLGLMMTVPGIAMFYGGNGSPQEHVVDGRAVLCHLLPDLADLDILSATAWRFPATTSSSGISICCCWQTWISIACEARSRSRPMLSSSSGSPWFRPR